MNLAFLNSRMSEVIFTGGYAPLTESDLDEFERWLKDRLPSSYRQFLLKENGGHPHKHRLEPPIGCYIEAFYSVTKVSDTMSLYTQIPLMGNELPKKVVVIGFTGEGNRVCLSLKDGKLYLWDHEVDYESSRARLDELFFLADSIQILIEQLRGEDAPPIDDHLMKMARYGNISNLQQFVSSGNDINACCDSGESLLELVALKGREDMVIACIRLGASLKGTLHGAVLLRRIGVVRLLLENGADPNELDERGSAPLDILPASVYQHGGPLVSLLKSHGARRTDRAEQ